MNKQNPFTELRSRFPRHVAQIDLLEQTASSLRYDSRVLDDIARWFKRGERWHEVDEARRLNFLNTYIQSLVAGRDDFDFLRAEAERTRSETEQAAPSGVRGFLFRVVNVCVAIARALGFS
ncbi:MAG: hypothetical protein HYV67_04800 [Candidatus Taylorbacteria bacterium]|nr:hypothetical protein [Candidatus Taylorbacteria bacterium]